MRQLPEEPFPQPEAIRQGCPEHRFAIDIIKTEVLLLATEIAD